MYATILSFYIGDCARGIIVASIQESGQHANSKGVVKLQSRQIRQSCQSPSFPFAPIRQSRQSPSFPSFPSCNSLRGVDSLAVCPYLSKSIKVKVFKRFWFACFCHSFRLCRHCFATAYKSLLPIAHCRVTGESPPSLFTVSAVCRCHCCRCLLFSLYSLLVAIHCRVTGESPPSLFAVYCCRCHCCRCILSSLPSLFAASLSTTSLFPSLSLSSFRVAPMQHKKVQEGYTKERGCKRRDEEV